MIKKSLCYIVKLTWLDAVTGGGVVTIRGMVLLTNRDKAMVK